MQENYNLRAPELLFRKIEDSEVEYQIEKLHKALEAAKATSAETAAPSWVPVKPEIVFDDFAKIDLRVGKIIRAEKVEKADKLLKLEVLLGFETRTIVSGIALHFKPEEIIGKQVTVVVNLAPRKMRGIESNGMILMAEDANGKLHFINPDDAIGEGSTVS
jgi:methionyl-tRNA synthetase